MTLRNLRIFLAVADCGSMSEAAKKMHIAQPSVSGTIAEIEDRYGVRLFERLGRRLYITETGVQLSEYARHIISMYDTMELKLKNADESDNLRIGATVTIGNCMIGTLIRHYMEDTQNNAPQVVIHNTRYIEQKLLKSELDIAVVEGKIRNTDLITQNLTADRLVVICSPHANPFGERTSVQLKELYEVPFILREEGSGTRELVDNTIPYINAKWVCNNSETILRAVDNGFGLAVISRRLAADWLESGRLIEIEVEDASFERQFSLVWHKNKYQSRSMEQFIDVCHAYADSI